MEKARGQLNSGTSRHTSDQIHRPSSTCPLAVLNDRSVSHPRTTVLSAMAAGAAYDTWNNQHKSLPPRETAQKDELNLLNKLNQINEINLLSS